MFPSRIMAVGRPLSTAAQVWAGHAGETGPVTVLPHELMGAVALLAAIGLVLVLLGVTGLWLLVKIHRQLKQREHDPTTRLPGAP